MAYQTNLCTTQKNVKSITNDTKQLQQLIGLYLRMGLVKMCLTSAHKITSLQSNNPDDSCGVYQHNNISNVNKNLNNFFRIFVTGLLIIS